MTNTARQTVQICHDTDAERNGEECQWFTRYEFGPDLGQTEDDVLEFVGDYNADDDDLRAALPERFAGFHVEIVR